MPESYVTTAFTCTITCTTTSTAWVVPTTATSPYIAFTNTKPRTWVPGKQKESGGWEVGEFVEGELTLEQQERIATYQVWVALQDELKKQSTKLATTRSMILLLSLLNQEQEDCLYENGWFHVKGADGFNYRVIYNKHGNIAKLSEKGEVVKCYCGHYGEELPTADTLVAQKLVLEFDPESFTKKANTLDYGLSPPYINWKRHIEWAREEIASKKTQTLVGATQSS